MRILLVNIYDHNNQKDQERLIRNQEIIKKEILKNSNIDTESEFFYRNNENIDEFLFEQNSGYQKQQNGKLFDKMDIVVIQGKSGIKPWKQKYQGLLILLRMCLFTQKKTFVSEGVFQCLVFIAASNLTRTVRIVNEGKECGVEGLKSYSNLEQLGEYKNNDYFLDNVSGDLYEFNQYTKQWTATANSGYHHHFAYKNSLNHSHQSSQPSQQFFHTHPHINHSKVGLYTVYKHPQHLQHYLVKTLPQSFQCTLGTNSWHIHPFNFQNTNFLFKVLLSTNNQPIMLSFANHNIIAVKFQLNQKYPQTIQILQNFIANSFQDFQAFSNKLSILQINFKSLSLANNRMSNTKNQNQNHQSVEQQLIQKGIKIRPISCRQFQNVGTTLRKHNDSIPITQNNAISQKSYKIIQNNKNTSNSKNLFDLQEKSEESNNRISDETFDLNQQEENKNLDLKFDMKNNSINILKRDVLEKQQTKKQSSEIEKSEQKFIKFNKIQQKNEFDKTSREIIQMLHPNISTENLPKNSKLWVPGQMKINQKLLQDSNQIIVKIKSQTSVTQMNKERMDLQKQRLQQLNKYMKKSLFSQNQPYQTYEELERQYQKNQDKNIIGTTRMIVNKIQCDQSHINLDRNQQNIQNYSFRQIDKTKWVVKKDFIINNKIQYD